MQAPLCLVKCFLATITANILDSLYLLLFHDTKVSLLPMQLLLLGHLAKLKKCCFNFRLQAAACAQTHKYELFTLRFVVKVTKRKCQQASSSTYAPIFIGALLAVEILSVGHLLTDMHGASMSAGSALQLNPLINNTGFNNMLDVTEQQMHLQLLCVIYGKVSCLLQ